MAKRSNGEGSYKKLPSGKWSAQLMVGYTDEGKRRIKTFTAPTKSEVKRKIEQYFEDLAVEKEQAKTLSFSEWADIWYADHKSEVEESTYWSYSFTLKTLKDYFGDRPVSEIKQLDINRFLDVLVERKRSKSTIAKCKSMLFQIFASAADNDLVTKNPVVRAKKVKKAAKEGQKMNKRSAFSQEEVEIMKRDLPNNLLGNSILTLIGTGMRVQELLALTKDDIAPDGSFIRVDKAVKMAYRGVLLLASGFSLSDIRKLKWADIVFVPGYTDFAVIGIRRDQLLIAKHDFSRPAIPDAAMYLRAVYIKLLETSDPADLANRYVVTTNDTGDKPAENKEIILAANNLLIRAGYRDSLITMGRPSKDEEAIPVTLLQSNYRHMLISKAGLKDDADTYHFLAGLVYRSSTYTNYESHTSPEARYRLYTILQSLNVEKPIRQITERHRTEDKLVYRAVPKTNHEAAQVVGEIVLKPGEEIRIRIPHGVTGRIESRRTEE